VLENQNVGRDEQEEASSDPAPNAATAHAHGSGLPVEPIESALQRVEAERDDLKDKYLRLLAEYDNFRKRTAKERIELTDRAQANLAIRLLDVLDDLDRVVAGDQSATSREVIHQALVLIDRKLRKGLEGAGLERIDPVGTPFDPALHEAVSVVPPPDPAQDHQVSSTFQAGYRFKGSLIRPARVQVYSAEGHA
jgi:molecular chaperone GrpE